MDEPKLTKWFYVNLAIINQPQTYPMEIHMFVGFIHIFPCLSHGFPMVFYVFPWFSHGFPVFSHGFPMVFPANLHPSRQDGAVKVYDRFLEARARNQGLNFRMDGTAAQEWPAWDQTWLAGTSSNSMEVYSWENRVYKYDDQWFSISYVWCLEGTY